MSGQKIASVRARQTIDCNCRPMVEVDVVTDGGFLGRGAAPTGKSVGKYESFVLRDEDPNEYRGMGVRRAVRNVNETIAPKLIGMDVDDQEAIDGLMNEIDGTENKSRLGGNAIYSTSIACFRAAAACRKIPLYQYIAGGTIKSVPVPSFNMINGGRNGSVCQSINEFLVVPWRSTSIEKAVEAATLIFAEVGKVIESRCGRPALVGRSMGWVAPSEDPREIFDILREAIHRAGFANLCSFALDAAASEMYDEASGRYTMNGRQLSSAELVDYYVSLSEELPLLFMEDILDENDWEGYRLAHQKIQKSLIIADDLTATNAKRLQKAKAFEAIDGFILKPNQVGSITEAMEAYRYAKKQNWVAIPSGRSGGVIDDVVMDFSVGLGVPFQKNGCPRSGERIEKLNFLIRASDLNGACPMADISSYVRF